MADPEQPDAIPDINSLTFEEAFRRLGEMAESLEKGGLDAGRGHPAVRRWNEPGTTL